MGQADVTDCCVLVCGGGNALKDAAGNEIKVGQTVVHTIHGEGIARGTIPLDRGLGVNVAIDWIGRPKP